MIKFKLEWFWSDEGLTELGAASLSLLTILLFWLFIIWFFGGYGRKATTHTEAESECARLQTIVKLETNKKNPSRKTLKETRKKMQRMSCSEKL
jgi:hypothetical protein